MITGTWYRGYHLERIGFSGSWKVVGKAVRCQAIPDYTGPQGVTWNEILAEVDKISPEPEVPSHICKECGHREIGKYIHRERLADLRLCFQCDFWLEWMASSDCKFVADGRAYALGGDGAAFRGFGGRSFRVRFFDGSVVETSNLWTQGEIPPHFRDRLPDTATLEAL